MEQVEPEPEPEKESEDRVILVRRESTAEEIRHGRDKSQKLGEIEPET